MAVLRMLNCCFPSWALGAESDVGEDCFFSLLRPRKLVSAESVAVL